MELKKDAIYVATSLKGKLFKHSTEIQSTTNQEEGVARTNLWGG